MDTKNTREKIISTGLKLFKTRGFSDVTVDEICRESGITRSAFYYHFQSKEQVMDKIYEWPQPFGIEVLNDLLSSDNNWGKLWRIYEMSVDWVIELGYEVLSTVMIINLQQRRNTLFPGSEDEIRKISTVIIRKGQEAGQFRNRSEPDKLLGLIKTVLMGITYEWCSREGEFDKKEATKQAVATLLDVEENIYEK